MLYNIQNFDDTNHNSIVTILSKLGESSGVTIATTLIIKNFSTLILLLEKYTISWYESQKRDREIYRNFRDVLFTLKNINNSDSNNAYNFCMRMYQLDTDKEKNEFMFTVASSFKNDFMDTMHGTAMLEKEYCKRRLKNYF